MNFKRVSKVKQSLVQFLQFFNITVKDMLYCKSAKHDNCRVYKIKLFDKLSLTVFEYKADIFCVDFDIEALELTA